MIGPLAFDQELSELSTDVNEKHEQFVDLFGHFVFWLRNWSIQSSQHLIESSEAREALAAYRREFFDSLAVSSNDQQKAAMRLAADTLDGFLQRLMYSLGDEGIDARLGSNHAYRFRVEMEILDVESEEIVHTETINRGGKFFGTYWGRWLNRHRDK